MSANSLFFSVAEAEFFLKPAVRQEDYQRRTGVTTARLGATTARLGATPTVLGATTTGLGATTTGLGATTTGLGATTTGLGATTTGLGATTQAGIAARRSPTMRKRTVLPGWHNGKVIFIMGRSGFKTRSA
jgi:hypothetical protein